MAVTLCIVLFSVFCPLTVSEQPQHTLNVPQVLLPYAARGSVNANFTLKTFQGCYTWTSSRPEVATVEPLYSAEEQGNVKHFKKRCSKEAMITVQSRRAERQITEVLVEEEVTGMILRCVIFVDKIEKLEIMTTTRELLLGESPEVFHVKAFDAENNLFSTLEMIVFDWDLITVQGSGSVAAQSIIKILPFDKSSYETTPEIYFLESQGLRGSSIIVEPINTGTAIVRAKLHERAFEDVPPAEVKLIVLDNVMLRPSHDTYILVNTSVSYTVVRMQRGRMAVVPMPSAQFEFKLTNTTVGDLDTTFSSVRGTQKGYTQMVLVDKNMLHIQAAHQPSAGIFVVEPASIGFSIVPDSNWVLQVDTYYAISVQLYDKDNHKINMADNIYLETTFSDKYFKVLWSSKNGSYHHVRALAKGDTSLKSVYTSIKIPRTGVIHTFGNPISGEQEAEIFDPVMVLPKILVFPWFPAPTPSAANAHQYPHQLNASGGSGTYIWTSANTTVSTVNTKGLVMTTSGIGHSEVKAADVRNTEHFDVMDEYVLPPRKMEFIPSPVEALVGSVLVLPLAMAACTGEDCREFYIFSDCRSISLTYTLSDASVFRVVEGKDDYEITPGSCMSMHLEALRSGFTVLTVTYQYKDILLKAPINVAAYVPLKVLDPLDVGIVTLCSTKNLLLEGAPASWILDTSGFYKDVTAERDNEIVIGNYATADYKGETSGSLHYFNVMCKALGEQVLKIKIGNQPSPKNPYPASSEVEVRFACMLPASVTLVPVINLPEVDGQRRSPENCVSSNKEIHVRNNQELKLILHLRDKHGRLFDNFTSLSVSWFSSNSSLAQFWDLSKSVNMMFHKDDENILKSLSYQTVHLFEKMGAVLIRATVEGYDCVVLRQCGLELRKPVRMALKGHLKLLLVPERKVLPQKATILNYPENHVKFLISGGSGHFAVKESDAKIARVNYQGRAEIIVVPKAEGLFTVSVNDLCLDSPVPALVNVQVSDIYGVDVVVVNKIGLGESVVLQLKILDMFGSPMLLDSLSFLQLVPHFTPDILVIRREPGKEDLTGPYHDTAYFTVRGGALGTASLTFTASTASGKSATSEPRDIQVFASLRLDPRVVVMVRGATFQVRATGGPTPQTATMFSVANETVSTVSSVGLVEAMNLGSTNLSGVVQVSDPQMGQTIVYSKDKVIIHVVELIGVKIFVTSTSLVTGTKISLYTVGLNDEPPFTFANAVPGLKFHWSSTNPDVCQVQSVYSKSGISVENDNDFRVDLHCINSGQTTIRMEMEVTNPHYHQVLPHAVLVDEVTFQVYDRLQLVSPIDGFLLLPHNVNTKIITNRDGSALITYELITGCSNHGSKASSVLSVDKTGRLHTHAVSGTAAVLVTVHEEFGVNQTVLVHVEVKPVASLSIACQSYVRASSDKLQAFPLGMNAQFIINLHDNIGRRFHSANVPLKYRLNRFDAVHIVPGPDNGTLHVKAMTVGEAILKVWDSSLPHIADYVRIRVDHGLTPTKAAVLLGMAQTFSTSVMSEGQGGQWSSSNSNIIKINDTTGVALAMSSGTTTVYYKIPEVYSAQTEVKVERPTFVRVSVANPNLIITNWPQKGGQGYVIPIVLGNHVVSSTDFRGANIKEGIILYEELGVRSQPPVRCFLTFSDELFSSLSAVDLFDVKPGLIAGKPMCYVIPKKASTDATLAASSGEAPLSLLVKVRDEIQGYDVPSDSLVLPFVPAFVVSKSEVQLTNREMKKRLVVTGTQKQLDHLMVRSLDESLVEVSLATASDDKQVEFTIAAPDKNLDPFANVAVEFKSSLTKQKVLVHVSYSPPAVGVPVIPCLGQTCPNKPVEEHSKGLWGLLLVLLAETSAWLIGFSIILGLIVLLLICLCNPRHRGGAYTPHVATPQPYTGSATHHRTSGGASPGSDYPGDSYVSSPKHHFRQTLQETTRRSLVSDKDKLWSGGAVPMGRVSPAGRSPNGLFSVTQ